jgi:Flp pilus assembly protein TadG
VFPSTFLSLPGRLQADSRGTISLIFGVSIFMIFGVAGIGLDSIRAHRTATRTSTALDAAALAAARAMSENETLTNAEVIAIARDSFAGNTPAFTRQGVIASVPLVTPNRTTGAVAMSTQLRVATTLGKVLGMQEIAFNKSTTVSFVMRKIELAMVLDVTGSMCAPNPSPCTTGPKIDALKAAATDVINDVIDPLTPSLVRIALVPYSASVNVTGHQNEISGGDSLDGCVMERLFAPERDTDAPPGGGDNYAVSGQLNSTANGRYTCPAARLLPLSNDKTLLTNTINGYGASGGTAGHIGLTFGWNTLSDRWSGVFSGASAPGPYNNPNVTKVVLLMTDGEFNTAYTAGTANADQIAESTARTVTLCNAMKGPSHNIQIYSVAFQAPAAAEALLRNCASSGSHYFDANDSAQLRAAFKQIAKRMQQIRVSQ